jgi:competence protein ComEC
MHLGILIGTVWWLCKLTGLMKRARAIVCIIGIAVFLLIVPPRAPTVRAAIIGWVFCASLLFKRRPNSLNTLSLAAIILLLIRPTGLFEAGWQLSFASVLGILLFCRRTHFFLYERITGMAWIKRGPKTKPFFSIISRPGPYLLALFTTGLTAWLGGAGILLYHFYSITPLTCIWTVAVFPLVWGILTLGFLKIILSFLLPAVAVLLGLIVTALSNFLIWVVTHIADLNISQILIGHVPLAVLILYYAFVLFVGFAQFRRPFVKKLICAATVSTLIVLVGVTKWHRTYRDNLVLTCLDVGHGQAVLARLPGRTVVPFLEYSGISRLDAITVSHNDSDHINGIPEIVQDCSVRAVYANDAFFGEPDTWGTANFLNEWLTGQGYEVQRLGEDLNFSRHAAVRILWPPKEIAEDVELTDNDRSLVVIIEFAGRRILLCSDIEEFAQRQLIQLYPGLRADVVVAPHHGSANTLDSSFLKSLGPEILVCSCGRSACLSGRVMEPAEIAQRYYTPIDGSVILWVSKGGVISHELLAKK